MRVPGTHRSLSGGSYHDTPSAFPQIVPDEPTSYTVDSVGEDDRCVKLVAWRGTGRRTTLVQVLDLSQVATGTRKENIEVFQ